MEPTTTAVSLESLMEKLNAIERKVELLFSAIVNRGIPSRWPQPWIRIVGRDTQGGV